MCSSAWFVLGHLYQKLKTYLIVLGNSACPIRAPESNMPLIHFLILELYMLLACLHHMLPYLPSFFTYSLLIFL